MRALPPRRPEAENFEQVMKAARRARQLVRQILTFSRRSVPTWEKVGLSAFVAETAAFLGAVARGVTIDHVKAASVPPVVADSAQAIGDPGAGAPARLAHRAPERGFSKAEVVECEMAGIDHRLSKPFTHISLGNTLAAALRKTPVTRLAPG